MENISKTSWKNVILLGGAFASYEIGSGFATGQEVLQYFGSWGGVWPIISPILYLLCVAVFSSMGYRSGGLHSFENPNDAYMYYGGKYVGKFIEIFSIAMIAGIVFIMFAGCGATINQYLGLPVYVGAIGMGIICVVVVSFGLEKVTNVLGVTGIIIIAFVVVVGVYTLATADVSLAEAQKNLPKYVREGIVLQPGFFGIKSPIASCLFYAGVVLVTGFPFLIANGSQRVKNSKEAIACGISSGVFYTLGVVLVLVTVLFNLDYIAENGSQIPILTAIEKNLPFLSGVFTIVILCAIFTTITGFLWVIGRRFAKDKTTKQRIIVIAVALIGIFLGSFIPFSTMINFLYPFIGCIGIVLFMMMIITDIRRRTSKSVQKPEANMEAK